MNDRVSFSLGMTINRGNYESTRLEAGFESDLLSGESPEAGLARVEGVVTKKINECLAIFGRPVIGGRVKA